MAQRAKLTIPNDVPGGLHIRHAAHDARRIIAEGQSWPVIADMAEASTLLASGESIVAGTAGRGMPTLHCGCPSSHLTEGECWSATGFPTGEAGIWQLTFATLPRAQTGQRQFPDSLLLERRKRSREGTHPTCPICLLAGAGLRESGDEKRTSNRCAISEVNGCAEAQSGPFQVCHRRALPWGR